MSSLPGDWNALLRFTQNLGDVLEAVSSDLEDELYRQTAEMVRNRIRTGRVSPKSKKAQGITLIDEMDYVADVGVWKGKDGVKYVGWPDEVHPSSGLRYKDIWRVHEYGTTDEVLPARPHLEPAVKDTMQEIPLRLKALGFTVG